MTAQFPVSSFESIGSCPRRYTRRHAKSFYFASHVLPKEKRLAAYSVYAFCRHVDNIVDARSESMDAQAVDAELAGIRTQLKYVFEADPRLEPHLRPLQQIVNSHSIPKEYFDALIDGVEMDIRPRRYERFAELDLYCYRVASVVGLIMTHIFGFKDPAALPYARDLGTAMQLTNILRDVGEDLRMKRLYLPEEDLRAFGVLEADLQQGSVSSAFREMMRMQVSRARAFYRSAEPGIDMLTDDGSRYCVQLMSAIYEGILDAIEENDYDVLHRRAYVPFWKKVRIAVRVRRRSGLVRRSSRKHAQGENGFGPVSRKDSSSKGAVPAKPAAEEELSSSQML